MNNILTPPKFNTFVIPIIREDLIERCIETIYKNTEAGSFFVFIIDQTINGIDSTKLRNQYRNLMVIRTPKSDYHTTGNLGFAQATNLGISLVTTPYFTMWNDDCEAISPDWWQGILDTFRMVEETTPERPAAIVCAASVRLADWSVGRDSGDDFEILPYKENYTKEDWDFLVREEHYVNERLTIQPGSVFDGVTMYACVCDTRKFLEVGMLPEQIYPGGGEDYWWSCLASMCGYRCVATTKSWVYHWWSKSSRSTNEQAEIKALVQDELRHNNNHADWGEGKFDIWGVVCSMCKEHLQTDKSKRTIAVCPKHPEEIYQIPESRVMPL
jgi:GT2 family glycosyltransferase